MKIKAFISRQIDRVCGIAARLILRAIGALTVVVVRHVRVLTKPAPALRIARKPPCTAAARAAGQLDLF